MLFHMGHENIAIPHVRARGRDGERGRDDDCIGGRGYRWYVGRGCVWQ